MFLRSIEILQYSVRNGLYLVHSLFLVIPTQESRKGKEKEAPKAAQADDRDLNLIRERLSNLLNAVTKTLRDDQKDVQGRVKTMLAAPAGFFWDSDYAHAHVLRVLNTPACSLILESVYVALTGTDDDVMFECPCLGQSDCWILLLLLFYFFQWPRLTLSRTRRRRRVVCSSS